MRNIGDTVYWVESHQHYGEWVPCPMCFGKGFVTIILGDESRTDSECGMCTHGMGRATGRAKTWVAKAFVHSGMITGISTRDGIKYEVTGGSSIQGYECYDSAEAAAPIRDLKQKEAEASRDAWFKDQFIQCKKNQLWSAGYHRSCIQSAERNIEWHKARLMMISERKKAP